MDSFLKLRRGITEIPDRALFTAIEAFQKSKGLRVDGVMKPKGEPMLITKRVSYLCGPIQWQ